VVKRRLEGRRGDASDADWATFGRLTGEWEPGGAATRRHLSEIATDEDEHTTIDRALEALRAAGMA
jgi:predicted kinase